MVKGVTPEAKRNGIGTTHRRVGWGGKERETALGEDTEEKKEIRQSRKDKRKKGNGKKKRVGLNWKKIGRGSLGRISRKSTRKRKSRSLKISKRSELKIKNMGGTGKGNQGR